MTQYKQKGNFEATELDGKWIILNPEKYTITEVNEAGGHCWSMLKKGQTVDSLSQYLAELFPAANKEVLKQDIEEFLNHLTKCGLIQHAD